MHTQILTCRARNLTVSIPAEALNNLGRNILLFRVLAMVTIPATLYFFPLEVKAQDQKLTYTVSSNGDSLGYVKFRQIVNGSSLHLQVESVIKARFLFLFTIRVKEEAIYQDGILVFSSVYRKLNGKEKTNLQVRLDNNNYKITDKGDVSWFTNYPIRFNLLRMYGCEPKQASQAYAENFGAFVPIIKTGTNQYKVILPDKNFNSYYYKDGICTKVEIHQGLYSLQFLLN